MTLSNTFLDGICFAIESKYKGCVVGYEDFLCGTLKPDEQGMINIQVLNISEEFSSEAHRFLFELGYELYEWKGLTMGFGIWDKEQTEEYFLADYNRLMKKKKEKAKWEK